jgi:hypothetical protein
VADVARTGQPQGLREICIEDAGLVVDGGRRCSADRATAPAVGVVDRRSPKGVLYDTYGPPLFPCLLLPVHSPHAARFASASTGSALIRSTVWRVSPVALAMVLVPAPCPTRLCTVSSCGQSYGGWRFGVFDACSLRFLERLSFQDVGSYDAD